MLVARCQPCHNSTTRTAGLDLSSNAGFAAGGQSGPIVSHENPEASRILRAISYDEKLKMPPTGKLKPEEIADMNAWVKSGAAWPEMESKGKTAASHQTDFTPRFPEAISILAAEEELLMARAA